MGDPVIDALSITITTLQEKISSLEEEVNAYRASDDEVIAHYKEVAKVGMPIIAYNNPFDTKVDLTPKCEPSRAPSAISAACNNALVGIHPR